MVFWQEVRIAARSLLRAPVPSLVIVLSIGLGVGANTLVFSWLRSTVLDPYPTVASPDRLVALNEGAPDGGEWPISWPVYRDWAALGVFGGLAAWTGVRLSRRGEAGSPAKELWAMLVSASYFDVLGVQPALGRAFTEPEEREAHAVAVLSHAYWQREFGADAAIIGRSFDIRDVEFTVIGVAPPGFVGTYVGAGFDVWVPATMQPTLMGQNTLEQRDARWLQGFARLRPGETREASARAFDAAAKASSAAAGDAAVTGGLMIPLRQQFLGSLVFPLLTSMLGITGMVLLVACANVASLLLARALVRQRELAVRVALGASRMRLMRQSLLESVLLGAAGLGLGVLLASAGRNLLTAFIPPVALRVELPIVIDSSVIGFAALVTSSATLLFGVVPALRASWSSPGTALRQTSGAGGPRTRLRDGLVAVQIALSLAAVFTAGLFARSVTTARQMDLGFTDAERLLLVNTDLAEAGVDAERGTVFVDQLLDRVHRVPGVSAATVATMVPLGFGGHRYADVSVAGRAPLVNENLSAERVVVGERYFESLGTRLVTGREFGAQDRAEGVPVAIVNESFARRFWPGEEALGRSFTQGDGEVTVVGVARDGKYRNLDDRDYPVAYRPVTQSWEPRLTLHVRVGSDDADVWNALRTAFADVDPRLPFLAPRTLSQHMRAATLVPTIGGWVLSAFGVLALLMTAVGLYGTLAYAVGARVRELSLRLSLGAKRGDLVSLVLGRAFLLTSIGLVVGLPLALMVARAIRGQLVGVGSADPIALGGALALLVVVVCLAAALPALRAARLDPAAALRAD